jgi:hypothetical protein
MYYKTNQYHMILEFYVYLYINKNMEFVVRYINQLKI